MTDKQHGGKRENAGRKPKHGERMEQKTIRLPREWVEKLAADFGTLQAAVEFLASQHLSK
jgi:hypothetical protein